MLASELGIARLLKTWMKSGFVRLYFCTKYSAFTPVSCCTAQSDSLNVPPSALQGAPAQAQQVSLSQCCPFAPGSS